MVWCSRRSLRSHRHTRPSPPADANKGSSAAAASVRKVRLVTATSCLKEISTSSFRRLSTWRMAHVTWTTPINLRGEALQTQGYSYKKNIVTNRRQHSAIEPYYCSLAQAYCALLSLVNKRVVPQPACSIILRTTIHHIIVHAATTAVIRTISLRTARRRGAALTRNT